MNERYVVYFSWDSIGAFGHIATWGHALAPQVTSPQAARVK